MENKTSKYFKYAIGEIILVVIGILIALQVNNWNEGYKLSIEEKSSLEELHTEAEMIVLKLKELVKRMDSLLIISEKTVATFSNQTVLQMNKRQASSGIIATGYYPSFELPNSTYRELNSSGKLQHLKSDKVKKSISQYYSKLEFVNGQLIFWRDTYTLADDWINGTLQFKYNPKDEDRSDPDFDLELLQSNKNFNTRLVLAFRNQLVFHSYRKDLYLLALAMCETIAQELGVNCNANTDE